MPVLTHTLKFFNLENGKTHLRWNLFAGKEQIVISKRGDKLAIKTLNPVLFKSLKKEVTQAIADDRYIKKVRFVEPGVNNVSTVEVDLFSSEVEVFSFYRERDKKYVIDFWSDEKKLVVPVGPIHKRSMASTKEVIEEKLAKEALVKEAKVFKHSKTIGSIKKKKKILKPKISKKNKWRDFRYGAAFVWDYLALSPELDKRVNLSRKTPEHFYPIKDRKFKKNEKEAHLQLCINLYKKKEWGLMAKSIELFQRKYGAENEFDLLEYLKANAIVRENFDAGQTEPMKNAMAMYGNISQRTSDYELKKALNKYLIAYHLYSNDYIATLKRAKNFYVVSKENYDFEESTEIAKTILHALAKLKQVEKIDELLKEKTISKLLSPQKILTYKIYVKLMLGNSQGAIELYKKAKKGLVKPIDKTIIYNTAEAMFRTANYKESSNLFNEFIKEYSYHPATVTARTRLALSYEMQNKKPQVVAKLYRRAIDRAASSDLAMEARIRYVALINLRKLKPTQTDKDFRILLDSKTGELSSNENIQKLLWQVRLRTLIVDEQYDKALAYLSAVPLNSMKATDRRAFEADGAEIVYGLILKKFENGDYARVVKLWEMFKQRYIKKVAKDPQLIFLVAKSLIKMGLFRTYEGVARDLRKIDSAQVKTFPIWVERSKFKRTEIATAELDVIKALKTNDGNIVKKVAVYEKISNEDIKVLYYRALASREKNDAKNTIKWIENFLMQSKDNNNLDAQEVAEMVMAYTDALYQTNQIERFEKVSKSLLKDTKKLAKKNPYMANVNERISYLNIEIDAGKIDNPKWNRLEKDILTFKKEYPESHFSNRLGFMLGATMIKNSKTDQGVKLFNEMLIDKKVSSTIKEMIKSELSLLKIRERTFL